MHRRVGPDRRAPVPDLRPRARHGPGRGPLLRGGGRPRPAPAGAAAVVRGPGSAGARGATGSAVQRDQRLPAGPRGRGAAVRHPARPAPRRSPAGWPAGPGTGGDLARHGRRGDGWPARARGRRRHHATRRCRLSTGVAATHRADARRGCPAVDGRVRHGQRRSARPAGPRARGGPARAGRGGLPAPGAGRAAAPARRGPDAQPRGTAAVPRRRRPDQQRPHGAGLAGRCCLAAAHRGWRPARRGGARGHPGRQRWPPGAAAGPGVRASRAGSAAACPCRGSARRSPRRGPPSGWRRHAVVSWAPRD